MEKNKQKLLFVVRNHGNSVDVYNRSILGVFSSAEKAAEATKRQMKIAKKGGHEIYPEVKVCRLNLGGYMGCSAFSIKEMLEDPKAFTKKVREWSTWQCEIFDEFQL